jgi:thiopeptide-type bacteriocin biosynthesis protein
MPEETDKRWIYYKIYPGDEARTDYLVTGALAEISRLPDARQWFFVHYTDEAGPHLRLRVQAHRDPGQLQERIRHVLEQALARLPTLPPTSYRPTITPTSGPVVAEPAARSAHLELERYQPDVESFGERGVLIAEHLSCASSEAAVRVLTDEYQQHYSRKTLVPLLMHATGTAFVPDADSSLWRDYASYWLAYAADHEVEWLPRFTAKADKLRADGVCVVEPDSETPGEAVEVLTAWRAAVASAAEAFRFVDDDPPRSPQDLAFHFLHLMNNRLGIMPIEEAYFATLIALNHRETVGRG